MTHDPRALEADLRDRLRPFAGRELSPELRGHIRAAVLDRLRHVPTAVDSPSFEVTAHPTRSGAVVVTARGVDPWVL